MTKGTEIHKMLLDVYGPCVSMLSFSVGYALAIHSGTLTYFQGILTYFDTHKGSLKMSILNFCKRYGKHASALGDYVEK